ncbi:MAG: DUF5692 family protein [Rhodospirillales bacterium]
METYLFLGAPAALAIASYAIVYGGKAANIWIFTILPPGVFLYLWLDDFAHAAGTSAFVLIKLPSVCMAALLIAMMRFNGWGEKPWARTACYLVLLINIAEAVTFEAIHIHRSGGDHAVAGNALNILAGILLMAAQAFPRFVSVGGGPAKDFRYHLGLGWVLAYTMWDFAFFYGTVPPDLLGDYVVGAAVHLLAPLLLIIGRSAALYIQMRTVSLALAVAVGLVVPDDPIVQLDPAWHTPALATGVALAALAAAAAAAFAPVIGSLAGRRAPRPPANLLEAGVLALRGPRRRVYP